MANIGRGGRHGPDLECVLVVALVRGLLNFRYLSFHVTGAGRGDPHKSHNNNKLDLILW